MFGPQSQQRFDQLPSTARPQRSGENVVERLAIGVVRREIAAMPASLVVQLALWPDEVAHWARDERLSESLVYNMLAARKPYSKTRARLADRLGVPTPMLDHLIESRRPQPSVRLGPDQLAARRDGRAPDIDERRAQDDVVNDVERSTAADGEWTPIDWRAPPWPRYREGTNAIERRAVRCIEVDVASMPAATVVGFAIWPETLAEWSRRERLKSSVVWATLSGSPSAPVRDALARRLGVALRDLDSLVTLARRVPLARRAWPLGPGDHAARPAGDATESGASVASIPPDAPPFTPSPEAPTPSPAVPPHDADDGSQLALGL